MSVSCRILNLPAVLKEKEVAFAATPSVGMAAASDALHTGWLTSEVKPAKADPWMNCRLLMFMMSIFLTKVTNRIDNPKVHLYFCRKIECNKYHETFTLEPVMDRTGESDLDELWKPDSSSGRIGLGCRRKLAGSRTL